MLTHDDEAPSAERLPAEYHRISVPGETGAQRNPCIFLVNGVLHVIVRVVQLGRAANRVAQILDDGSLVDVRPLRADGRLQIEDLRVFSWRDKLWALACADQGRQALIEFNETAWTVARMHVLDSPRRERNWMPCVDGDTLKLVYSTDPLTVLHVIEQQSISSAFATNPSPHDLMQVQSYIRGGSPLVHDRDGWLAIVHQIFRPPQHANGFNRLMSDFWAPPPVQSQPARVHLHYFARFTSDLSSVVLSHPFYFHQFGVEFCPGLIEWKGQFVASFCVGDREAWLAAFDGTAVDSMFTAEKRSRVEAPPMFEV